MLVLACHIHSVHNLKLYCSDSVRTKETLDVMQGHFGELRNAELHFLASFYSVSAMDGHTADHLQRSILDYSTDAMKTIMYMFGTLLSMDQDFSPFNCLLKPKYTQVHGSQQGLGRGG